jgi:hypothetical protein
VVVTPQSDEAFRWLYAFLYGCGISAAPKSNQLKGETKMKDPMFSKTIQRIRKTVKNAIECKIVFGAILALFVLNGLGSAQSGTTPTATETSPRQHAPIRLHRLVPGGVESENWSGYTVTGSEFTAANGSWHVPEVQCNKTPNTFSSFWVGIDGYPQTNVTLEQIGTSSYCNGTTPVYFAWYEFIPNNPTEVTITNFPVVAGDVIGASVTYSDGKFTVGIHNHNTGQEFHKTVKVAGAQRISAEWIAEAPSNTSGGILPLADFDVANFGFDYTADSNTNTARDSSTHGPISDFGSDVVEITMVSSKNVVEAVPTSLTKDGTSFRVHWKSE